MKIKMHLLGASIAVLLSIYAVTAYAGQEIREHKKSKEDMIEPEIRCPKADGSQGYYRTRPDISIFHREAGAVTKYEFLSADNTKKTGSLELMEGQEEESVYLAEDNFKEGENILRVWMEKILEENESERNGIEENEAEEHDVENNGLRNNGTEDQTGEHESGDPEAEGHDTDKPVSADDETDAAGKGDPVKNDPAKDEQRPEEIMSPTEPEIVFEKEIRFLLDTKKPDNVRFSYDKAVWENSILTNEPVELTLKSEDEGSGLEAIYYKTGDGAVKVLQGDSGTITLNPGFYGTVEAYAVDKAGNQSDAAVSEKILCENTPPEIRIETKGGTESWSPEPVEIRVKVSDDSLSSGLRSLKCYAGGEVTIHKENDLPTDVTYMETVFTVDIPSEEGAGIPVFVETADHAGNDHSESRQIYIDNTAPAIRSEGIHDHMITGKPVKGRMIIQEENDLASAKMEIWKMTSDKKRELLEEKKTEPDPFSGPQKLEWDIALSEDGIYEIHLTAKDRAGHENSRNSQIILDKTNPVIRYVDQMQGAYVPYFQWNYGKEEVVQDDTDYSYDIFLDGMFYTTGKKITKEGVKMLQVKAVDAAGNESTAEAVFEIDHTPPRIRVSDVEDGNSYKDTAMISISVDGKGEYLKEITINSEKMKLEADCRIFTRLFQEPGDYQIQVLAEDLAGNQEKEQITFRIEEQKRMSGGGWKPVTRIFRNVKDTTDQRADQEAAKQEKSPAVWLLLLCFVLAALARLLKLKARTIKITKNSK